MNICKVKLAATVALLAGSSSAFSVVGQTYPPILTCSFAGDTGISVVSVRPTYQCGGSYGSLECGYFLQTIDGNPADIGTLFDEVPADARPVIVLSGRIDSPEPSDETVIWISISESINVKRFIWGDFHGNGAHRDLQDQLFGLRVLEQIPLGALRSGFAKSVTVPALVNDQLVGAVGALNCKAPEVP